VVERTANTPISALDLKAERQHLAEANRRIAEGKKRIDRQ
jgi:hypothetical protein